MKENQRKCLKCGRSPDSNPDVKLFRFPQPGVRNTARCEAWAKYCFPDRTCSLDFQIKLYSEHRMLCDRHFKPVSFIDFESRKLHRNAVPEDVMRVLVEIPGMEPVPGPSRLPLIEILPSKSRQNITSAPEIKPTESAHTSTMPEDMTTKRVAVQIQSAALPPATEQTVQENVTEVKRDQRKYNDPSNKEKVLYSKCRKLLKKVCDLRNRMKKLKNDSILKTLSTENAVKVLMKKITPALALILQGEIKNFKRKTKGRRWTKDQKITALRLYKRSPTCYRLLRRLFCLPAPTTLRKLLSEFTLQVGINPQIFKILGKFTASQEAADNNYVLMFDEMSLRKNISYNTKTDQIDGFQDHGIQGRSQEVASHALVFMIGCIRKKLKQPIVYYLSGASVTADRLAVLIKEVLHHCFAAGINVVATVCDMDGANRKALAELGATTDYPCFQLEGKKIVTLYDAPHLLKCFRNLFLKYDVKHPANISSGERTGTGVAKWSHIQQFYEVDSQNPNFVFAPVLRKEHLAPSIRQKMKVNLAAQVLSHSVAAGMYCKISQGELTTDATVTADLISKMDKLFDCLNSDSADLRRGKPHCTNMTAKTPHLAFFREMKKVIKNIEYVGLRAKPPSADGWLWTISGIEMLWRNLTDKHTNIKSLATKRLQQDPLENLFGCIRGHCGSNRNPTTTQFVAALKTALLSSLTHVKAGGNCEADDNAAILDNLKTLLTPTRAKPNTAAFADDDEVESSHALLNINDFPDFGELSGEIQACAYVCGFILKKFKSDCTQCKENLFAEKMEIEHHFVETKEYRENKKSLQYATRPMIECVEFCASEIKKILESNAYKKKLKENISKSIATQTSYFDFLKCSTHKDNNINLIILNTFCICIKRFCVLKNRMYAETASQTSLREKIAILKHI